jgi:hypothetical protein
MHAPRRAPKSAIAATLVAAVAALFFSWVLTLRFTTPEPFQDFRFHNQVAAEMAAGAPLELPHPLYHVLAAALAAATGFPVSWAGMAVAVLAQAGLALVAFLGLRAAAGGRAALAAVAALGLTVVAPLFWFTPASREFYFGYLFPNALHNPTIILLRPLALGLFLACAVVLAGGAAPRPARTAGLALLTVSCALAKPSYLICLLPALGLAWLREGLPRDRRWSALLLGVLVPGALVAAAQAWFTLTTDRMEPTTIAFAPLEVVFLHTRRHVPLVAAKLALSIAFPLAVAALFAREAARDAALRVAWLAFLAGAFYAYGLAETGPRITHGNFLWSGQAATAVLFAASARFALGRIRAAGRDGHGARLRLAACAVAFALHVASGLGYAVRFARTGQGF